MPDCENNITGLTQSMRTEKATTTPTADGGAKKSPLSMTIESLRKDILLYSDRLMLNPKARADAGKGKPKKSRLAEALKDGP